MNILSIDPAMSNIGLVIYNFEKNILVLSQTITYKDSEKNKFRKELLVENKITEENQKEYFGSMWTNFRLNNMLNRMIDEIVDALEEQSNKSIDMVLCESQFGDRMSDSETIPKIIAGKLGCLYKSWKPTEWKKELTGKGNMPDEVIYKIVDGYIGENLTKHMSEHEKDAWALILTYLKVNDKIEITHI